MWSRKCPYFGVVIDRNIIWEALTNYMEQNSSWEANSNSVCHEIPCLLWNLNVHYHLHNSPPLVPILSHMHPVHTVPPYFPVIHSNIILPFTPRSSKCSLRISNQNIACIYHLFHPCYMPHQSHSPWFDHPNNTWWSVEVIKLLIMQSSPASCPFLPLRPKYSPHTVFKIYVLPLVWGRPNFTPTPTCTCECAHTAWSYMGMLFSLKKWTKYETKHMQVL